MRKHELLLLTAELVSLRERVKPRREVSTHGLMASTVNLVNLMPFSRAFVPYTGMGHSPLAILNWNLVDLSLLICCRECLYKQNEKLKCKLI